MEGVHTVLVLVTKTFATLCIEQNKAILKPYYSCLKYIAVVHSNLDNYHYNFSGSPRQDLATSHFTWVNNNILILFRTFGFIDSEQSEGSSGFTVVL